MISATRYLEVDAFLSALHDRTIDGISTIALDGGELPVLAHVQDSPSVVFCFSGAVDRKRLALPRFSATDLHHYVPASVISLADPSLARDDELGVAWYAGHEGFELQQILPGLLQRIIDNLGVTRVVFVGSSGGGFAALYYAWRVPGSIAVVSNPQTNLQRYLLRRVQSYRTTCWPALDTDAPLSSVIDADLAPLYAARCDNTVVYLQVASDTYHIRRHFSPFAAALPRDYGDRFIVRMANWGMYGHHPVPPNIWVPWIEAALCSPDMSATSIETTWAAQNPHELPPLRRRCPPPALDRDELIAADLASAAHGTLLGFPFDGHEI